ncbi:conserved hypothetical pox protein [Squirrelpox virus]|uniref:Conserved hypothetical pox protein n=1 Tax=Squirrelpox virus TaxID=240426 RepID=U3UBI2_9POXV|nr:conserved hypothetical pox protein [Squirrelpox virus]CCD83254.1 conserved hypothetical pox protein [Squirrelpox virus]
MDERLRVLAGSVFGGELSTVDIMALKAALLDRRPAERVLCADEGGRLVLDLDYGDCRASEYLDLRLRGLDDGERRARAPEIARLLTEAGLVADAPADAVRRSPLLRRVQRLYRKGGDLRETARVLERMRARGVDPEFVKESLFRRP